MSEQVTAALHYDVVADDLPGWQLEVKRQTCDSSAFLQSIYISYLYSPCTIGHIEMSCATEIFSC
jgi:hypothetical protein